MHLLLHAAHHTSLRAKHHQSRGCAAATTQLCCALCQAAQALQNVDNSLELACQWLLAAASRSDDDGTPGGARVGALPRLLPLLIFSAPCFGCRSRFVSPKCHQMVAGRALGHPRCVAPEYRWFMASCRVYRRRTRQGTQWRRQAVRAATPVQTVNITDPAFKHTV